MAESKMAKKVGLLETLQQKRLNEFLRKLADKKDK